MYLWELKEERNIKAYSKHDESFVLLLSFIIFHKLYSSKKREMNESIRWLFCDLVKFYVNKSEVTWVSDMTYNVSSIGEIKTALKMMPVVQHCCDISHVCVDVNTWTLYLNVSTLSGVVCFIVVLIILQITAPDGLVNVCPTDKAENGQPRQRRTFFT